MKLSQGILIGLAAWSLAIGGGASAQVQQIDPNSAIDGDLPPNPGSAPVSPAPQPAPQMNPPAQANTADPAFASPAGEPEVAAPGMASAQGGTRGAADSTTYREDDLIGAAEGVFGKGAKGLAMMIQDILKKQGQPNAYITGREAGGAVVVGLRYGSGMLHHKVEGERPVYWTGPSIGFDAGANAASAFVLVYNLYDSEAIYKRFPAGEGQAYLVGGFNVSYMRKGDVVLIPVRAGVELVAEAGIDRIREKSIALTEFAISVVDGCNARQQSFAHRSAASTKAL